MRFIDSVSEKKWENSNTIIHGSEVKGNVASLTQFRCNAAAADEERKKIQLKKIKAKSNDETYECMNQLCSGLFEWAWVFLYIAKV